MVHSVVLFLKLVNKIFTTNALKLSTDNWVNYLFEMLNIVLKCGIYGRRYLSATECKLSATYTVGYLLMDM